MIGHCWNRKSPRNLKISQPLGARYKNSLAPTEKKLWREGRVYDMENKDAKYRLPESCYSREPEVRNCKNYTRNHFFVCLRFVFTIFYTGSFELPPEKNYPHLNCQFPPKTQIWPKSLLYKPSAKWLKGCELWLLKWEQLMHELPYYLRLVPRGQWHFIVV